MDTQLGKIDVPVPDLNQKNSDGYTPLIFAVLGKDIPKIKYLLSKKVDPNIQDTRETLTALDYALQSRDYFPGAKNQFCKTQWEICELLLTNGANPNIRNCRNETSIFRIIDLPKNYRDGYSSVKTLKLLQDHGADLYITSKDGLSILNYARKSGDYKLMEYLLQYSKSDPVGNVYGPQKCSSMLYKSINEPMAVKLLLDHGADPHIKTTDGLSVFDSLCCPESLVYILEASCKRSEPLIIPDEFIERIKKLKKDTRRWEENIQTLNILKIVDIYKTQGIDGLSKVAHEFSDSALGLERD